MCSGVLTVRSIADEFAHAGRVISADAGRCLRAEERGVAEHPLLHRDDLPQAEGAREVQDEEPHWQVRVPVPLRAQEAVGEAEEEGWDGDLKKRCPNCGKLVETERLSRFNGRLVPHKRNFLRACDASGAEVQL